MAFVLTVVPEVLLVMTAATVFAFLRGDTGGDRASALVVRFVVVVEVAGAGPRLSKLLQTNKFLGKFWRVEDQAQFCREQYNNNNNNIR
jgi:hypothetical protein